MADGRDEEGEGIEGFEETGDSRLGSRDVWYVARWIVWQNAELKEKIKACLKNVDDMAEIVVENKLVVGMSAGE